MSRIASDATPRGTVWVIDVIGTGVLGGERPGLELTVKVPKSDLPTLLPIIEGSLPAGRRRDDSWAQDSRQPGGVDTDGEEFLSVVEPWEVCPGKYNDAIDPRDLLSEPNWRHGVHGAELFASSNHSSNAPSHSVGARHVGLVAAVNEAEGAPT